MKVVHTISTTYHYKKLVYQCQNKYTGTNNSSQYYHHNCALESVLLGFEYSSGLLSDSYQRDKYDKHTILDPKEKCVSIFNSLSTGLYEKYVEDAIKHGFVETKGTTRNIHHVTTGVVGTLYNYGKPVHNCDAIRLVLSSGITLIHTFSESSTSLQNEICTKCKGFIIQD